MLSERYVAGVEEIVENPLKGIGINLLENAPEIRPPLVQRIKMRGDVDGFVIDQ